MASYRGKPSRLDDLPARLDDLLVRLDGLPVRLDGLPVRLDGLPVRLDDLPARLDGLPARLDGLPARLDGLPVWQDGLSADGIHTGRRGIAPAAMSRTNRPRRNTPCECGIRHALRSSRPRGRYRRRRLGGA